MFQRLVYFSIGSTFCFVFCEASVKTVVEEELQKIKSDEKEIKFEMKILDQYIKKQDGQCEETLRTLNVNTFKDDSEFQRLINFVSSLTADIYKMNSRKEKMFEALRNIQKLQFGTRVSMENFGILKQRRTNRMTLTCLNLERMAGMHESRVPQVLKDSSEAVMVLQNQLQLEQRKLSNLILTKMEKKMKLRVNEAVCKQKQKSLSEVVERLNDSSEAIETVDRLKVELKEEKMNVSELARSLDKYRVMLEEIIGSAKKESRTHKQYEAEELCYSKVIALLRQAEYDKEIWNFLDKTWLQKMIE